MKNFMTALLVGSLMFLTFASCKKEQPIILDAEIKVSVNLNWVSTKNIIWAVFSSDFPDTPLTTGSAANPSTFSIGRYNYGNYKIRIIKEGSNNLFTELVFQVKAGKDEAINVIK